MSMALFVWNDYYSVGDHRIDHQHQVLVDLANRIHDEYMRDLGDDELPKSALLDYLEELVEYTEMHFAFEEQLMEEADYPELADHKKLHEELLLQLTEMKLGYEQNLSNAEELVQFVVEWLTKHILGADKKYTPYLQKVHAKAL